jgi:putative addiction module component (TIGR02574 family)
MASGAAIANRRAGRVALGPQWPGNLRELAVETRMDSALIFDLSPSEKLQLVEDLWDDLAATQETVPVHDWQERELARRKANLLKNPASGLSWEDVKRNVRARHAR